MSAAKEWVEQLMGGASIRSVADAAEISHATLSRQVKEDSIQPDTLVKLARYYRVSPVGGLIALGLLSYEDAEGMKLKLALGAASDQELVEEVLARLQKVGRSVLSDPMSNPG